MNHHTQTIALWLGNECEMYFEVQDMLANNKNVYDFAIQLREFVKDRLFNSTDDAFIIDVLQSSLCEVNWRELSDDYWTEYHNIDAA